ncbi:conserved exported hypothetical protein [Bradyrhizobium oligotrophicum S58]|uniref:Uncharacterized protein n=1 Tax=Bradyrhizobium oligotrophicum S58 TaxID=1245469 RepID=M4ZEQ8_9BRAD|nr:hypothetical protein [Bradyrhizobium oligotrophicum]BAM92298.1 conserved exported hypothetical protein [Bradyrhizobium oligotrophicum S58]
MRRAVLTAALMGMTATAAWAEGLFWVVGNRATNRCEIVTSNPVIIGDIWFADGPYKSLADAKLARSTINACPNKDMTSED